MRRTSAEQRAKQRPVCWDRYPEAFRFFLRGATFPTASRVAAVVGTWLTVVNHSSVIADGSIPWLKMALNYLTPFTVASIGFLAARRRTTLERLWTQLQPGEAGSGADSPGRQHG